MPITIKLILGLAALTFIVSAAVLYLRALSSANGLNFLRWAAWRAGTFKALPDRVMFRFHLLWVATMVCWTMGASDWRLRLLYGVLTLFFVAILWITETRKTTRRSFVDRQSVLKLTGEIQA